MSGISENRSNTAVRQSNPVNWSPYQRLVSSFNRSQDSVTLGGSTTIPDSREMRELHSAMQSRAAEKEAGIRARYIQKFIELSDFRNDDKLDAFRIVVFGDPLLEEKLKKDIDGNIVRGRPIRVVSSDGITCKEDFENKGIVGACFGLRGNYPKGLPAAAIGAGALTVGRGPIEDTECALSIERSCKRLYPNVNVNRVRDSKIKISPTLVKVASSRNGVES